MPINPEEYKTQINNWFQQVIHESYIPNSFPISEFLPLYFHLRDILIRIALKKANYTGNYRKAIPPIKRKPIDWVTKDTPYEALWHLPSDVSRTFTTVHFLERTDFAPQTP